MTKALLVEDDPKLSRLIAQFPEQHGFNVAQAYRGDHAVEAFRRHDPAITILDLMLPGRDGLQVCRDLRAFSSAPILMLTAREDDLDQILGLESGADDYVIKPVEPRAAGAHPRAAPAQPAGRTAGASGIRPAGHRPAHPRRGARGRGGRPDHHGIRDAVGAGQPPGRC